MPSRNPVTQTKISVPRRRAEILSRKRLLDLLNGFMDTKLAIIAAPAGYGKTSLLTDLAKQSHLPICWYSIDTLDQGIIRFITYFISSINKRFPAFGESSFSAIADKYDENINIDSVCTVIVNDLYEHVLEHFVIILDDYHLLGSDPKVEQFISQFIQAVDENCHIIIASRALLTLPNLPLLVAQSQVSGLSYEELSFTTEEIQSLFIQNYHLELPPDAINNLMSQTEGWITGLVLATQMYGQETSRLARIKRVTGVSLYDYLSEQVFLRQPDRIQTFLLFTSLLEEFDIQICQEILEGCMGKPNPDWAELVNHTLRNNLFALPVGDNTISIRYHHLFRDFLQTRAFKDYPRECRIILSRLADYYRKHNEWVHAFKIFKQLDDSVSIIAMLEEDGSQIMSSGNLKLLSEWLDELSEESLFLHPDLMSLLGPVKTLRGQVEEGLTYLDKAIPYLLERGNRKQLVRAHLRQSDAHRLLGRYDLAIRDASQALSLCGSSKALIAFHAEALRSLGLCYYQTGALKKSKKHLDRSLVIYKSLNDTHNIALLSMESGLVSTNMGEYEQAKKYYLLAFNLWSKSSNSVWLSNLSNNLGVLYHQMGDFVTAISTLELALAHARQGGYPRMEAFSLTSIGDVYRDLGAFYEAEQAYQKALTINEQIKDRLLKFYLDLAEADLALLIPNIQKARIYGLRVLEQTGEDTSDLETALASCWHGHFLICENNPGKAITSLLPALELFDRERDRINGALTRFYLAIAYYLTGDFKTASNHLSNALRTANIVNGWSNLIIPAHYMVNFLKNMANAAELSSASNTLLIDVARFEESLPALRRHIRQQTRTIPFGPPRLSIRGLGTMQVKLNNKTVTKAMWQTTLSRDLFFYLLYNTAGVTKEEIGLAFWPDADPEDIKLRFKNAIYRLRHAIGKEVILFDDDRYFFNRSLDYEYDVELFNHELTQAKSESQKSEKLKHLITAIQLYKGVFVPDFSLIDIIAERENLQRLFENICIEAAELAFSLGDYKEAIRIGLRAIEVDPYLESAYQIVFKTYAVSGNKPAIVKLYMQLKQILQNDLSTSPSSVTEKLYKELI